MRSNIEKGEIIGKEQCPECASHGADNSKDNLIIYTNGAWCFSCGKDPMKTSKDKELLRGAIESIPSRGLSKATCEKYGVEVGTYNNSPVVMYNILVSGKVVAQKIRSLEDKSMQFWSLGGANTKLFGQHSQNPTDKVPIVITEGEYDAMTVFQETGLPAVSITKGAAGAAKEVSLNLDWLQQWKYVILCFDNDEPGQAAVESVLAAFEVGQVKVAKFPMKDANDMLMAGRGAEIKKFLWDAEVVRPPSIVCPNELIASVLEKPTMGMKWPWEAMNEITYGFRTGEIYVVAAAESVGKTEFVKELIYDLLEKKVKVGVFSLEQNPEDTIRRLIGGKVNKRLHLPTETWWDETIIKQEIEALQDHLYLYNTKIAALPLEKILINIRYLVKCYGVKFILLDNLTALCASAMIDGKHVRDVEYIGLVMSKLFSVIKELNVTILVVSHLATDKMSQTAYVSTAPKNSDLTFDVSAAEMDKRLNKPGMHWETGRIPKLENIYGSGTLRKLADFIIVLSRNRTSEDFNEHRTTYVKFLKTRIDSSNEGKSFKLYYDYDTGRLVDN
jgi:twinkle protein